MPVKSKDEFENRRGRRLSKFVTPERECVSVREGRIESGGT